MAKKISKVKKPQKKLTNPNILRRIFGRKEKRKGYVSIELDNGELIIKSVTNPELVHKLHGYFLQNLTTDPKDLIVYKNS